MSPVTYVKRTSLSQASVSNSLTSNSLNNNTHLSNCGHMINCHNLDLMMHLTISTSCLMFSLWFTNASTSLDKHKFSNIFSYLGYELFNDLLKTTVSVFNCLILHPSGIRGQHCYGRQFTWSSIVEHTKIRFSSCMKTFSNCI